MALLQRLSVAAAIIGGMAYTIGFRGCQHLGYDARGMRTNRATGWNQRVIDGHVAHRLTMEQMLAAGVDGIVDGGDLAHWSKPDSRDMQVATEVDDLRVAAGGGVYPWLRGNTGNHDVGAVTGISAASALHRPTLDAAVVFPGNNSECGPQPGLYEVHQPDPAVPLYLHIVSHSGLIPGAGVDPEPIPGGVNILSAHGIFTGDPRQRDMWEQHGQQRIIPSSWADRGWDALMLSDLHVLGAVPGYENRGRGQVWYTGSAARRGFSDPAGPRGWLLLSCNDDGSVTVTPQMVWQRPQFDLPIVDAAGLSATEIDDAVAERLAAGVWWDAESEELTGDGGAILRQRITNVDPTVRQQMGALRARWDNAAKTDGGAAYWEIRVDTVQAARPVVSAGSRTVTSRITDFAGELTARVGGTGRVAAAVEQIPPAERDTVLSHARMYLSGAADDNTADVDAA